MMLLETTIFGLLSDDTGHLTQDGYHGVHVFFDVPERAQLKRRVGTAFMRLTLSLVVIRQHASASFRRA